MSLKTRLFRKGKLLFLRYTSSQPEDGGEATYTPYRKPPPENRYAMQQDYQDILLIDDDAVVRTMLADLLVPAGFKVRHARNGIEGLRAVQEHCPFIVITDWVMSAMNGIEFCRALRNQTLPHYVHVILLTAKSHTQDLIMGLSVGANDFLTKPFSEGELSARLQNALRILELEGRLNDLARRDSLTNALNRRTFHEILDREWSRAVRYGHPLSCVMMDADHFKRINDRFGHLMGDHVLKALAETLEGQSRCEDCVCRWGGEEFCILLPETDEQGAHIWAERCCSAIAAIEFRSGQHDITVTASFGVAEWCDDMQNPEQLVHCADQALYAAKRAGRNQVASFGSLASQEQALAEYAG